MIQNWPYGNFFGLIYYDGCRRLRWDGWMNWWVHLSDYTDRHHTTPHEHKQDNGQLQQNAILGGLCENRRNPGRRSYKSH